MPSSAAKKRRLISLQHKNSGTASSSGPRPDGMTAEKKESGCRGFSLLARAVGHP